MGDADEACGERSRNGGRSSCAERERGATAGTDRDDGVVCVDVQLLERVPACGLVVLGGLALARSLRVGAGDRGDDLVTADAEGRLALGGIERGQASGRAGTCVDEAAARAQPLGDRVDDV